MKATPRSHSDHFGGTGLKSREMIPWLFSWSHYRLMGKRSPLRMLVESALCRGEVGAPEAAVGLGARHLLCLLTKVRNGLGGDRPSLTLWAPSQLRTSLLHTRQNEDIFFFKCFSCHCDASHVLLGRNYLRLHV